MKVNYKNSTIFFVKLFFTNKFEKTLNVRIMKDMKIKKVTTLKKVDDQEFISEIVNYDINGNIIDATSFYADGDVEGKVVTTYNEKNFKIEVATYVDNNDFAEKSVFVWDANDKLEREEICYADGSLSIRSYDKNDKDNSLTITLIDEDNELEEMEVLKFDVNKNLIEKISYDENKKIIGRLENIYDQNNLLIEKKEYDEKNKIVSSQKQFFNDNNNLIKRLTYNSQNKIVGSMLVTYDDFQRVVEQNMDNNYFIIVEYDDQNNSQTEQRRLANGTIQWSRISKYNENKLLIQETGLEYSKTFEYQFYE